MSQHSAIVCCRQIGVCNFVTLREEHRLRVLKRMVLRTTLVLGDYVSGKWSKLNELRDMYWVIWERHVARSGIIKMHTGFGGET